MYILQNCSWEFSNELPIVWLDLKSNGVPDRRLTADKLAPLLFQMTTLISPSATVLCHTLYIAAFSSGFNLFFFFPCTINTGTILTSCNYLQNILVDFRTASSRQSNKDEKYSSSWTSMLANELSDFLFMRFTKPNGLNQFKRWCQRTELGKI